MESLLKYAFLALLFFCGAMIASSRQFSISEAFLMAVVLLIFFLIWEPLTKVFNFKRMICQPLTPIPTPFEGMAPSTASPASPASPPSPPRPALDTTPVNAIPVEVKSHDDKLKDKADKNHLSSMKDYQGKDITYYMNKGDLIDKSWDNPFAILDTKYWKPYNQPPPVCSGGGNASCEPCGVASFTPYLDVTSFDAKRKIMTQEKPVVAQ